MRLTPAAAATARKVTSAIARRTHGSRWRRALAPPGSRRQRVLRLLARGVEDLACSLDRRGPALSEVVACVEASRGAVLFLPSIGWRADLVQRPHHLARAFARAGYVAVFDSTNVHDELYGFAEIERRLFVFRGRASWLRALPSPVLWTLPYNHHAAGEYPGARAVIYDWIDDLSLFTDYDAALLRRNHERAMVQADVVASVARTLHESAASQRPDALYLPNAVEEGRFAPEGPLPDDPAVAGLRAEGKPVAGYYGALAGWFDYELVEAASRRRPDWNFLLVGPDYDGSLRLARLLDRPNVVWIGTRPYETLPSYLRLFDVALIPFRLNTITRATSPLKLYEYFAGGRPVITTAMPECAAHPEVHVVATAEELAGRLDAVRESVRDPAVGARLRRVAAENSWAARVRQVESALTGLPDQRPAGSP